MAILKVKFHRIARKSVFTCSFLAAAVIGAAQESLPTATPEVVGMSTERLKRIDRLIETQIAKRKLVGAVSLVVRRGRLVHFNAIGMSDAERREPLEHDAIVRIFSMTKPVTSVAALMLYLMGKNHVTEAELPTSGVTLGEGAGFGLGFRVLVDPARSGEIGSKGQMGWGGLASTSFFIDPAEELIAILMTQKFPTDTRLRRDFQVAVYQAITESNVSH